MLLNRSMHLLLLFTSNIPEPQLKTVTLFDILTDNGLKFCKQKEMKNLFIRYSHITISYDSIENNCKDYMKIYYAFTMALISST